MPTTQAQLENLANARFPNVGRHACRRLTDVVDDDAQYLDYFTEHVSHSRFAPTIRTFVELHDEATPEERMRCGLPPFPLAGCVRFLTGQYAHRQIGDVFAENPNFVRWYSQHMEQSRIATYCTAYLQALARLPQPNVS